MMKYNLLRLSLLSMLFILCGNLWAADSYKDITATWDFVNDCAGLNKGNSALTSIASDVDGIELTISGGNTRDNDNSYQFMTGVTIQIPVKTTKDVITVIGYPGYTAYTIGNDEGTDSSADVTHKVTSAEVAQGYALLTAGTGNRCYIKSITVIQKSGYGEKALYTTDFTEWDKITNNGKRDVKTKYSAEKLTFTLSNVNVDPAGKDDSKFPGYIGYMQTNKYSKTDEAEGPYAVTTSLKSITKVILTQCATGSKRGIKVWAKGDGDDDWVVIHNKAIANSKGETLSLDINRTNCQLKFTNCNAEGASMNNNAYVVDLAIYGMVDMSKSPALGSFEVNGTKYEAADIFEQNTDGDMVATVEISKTATMISENNPLTNITVDNGELGTVIYAGDATQATVTMPVTANGETLNYILTVAQKPDYTLTYYNVDGKSIGTQIVEKDATITTFNYTESDVTVANGKAFRGWAQALSGSKNRKFTVDDVITANTNLYALVTDVETESTTARYDYDLTDTYFYPEDHEALTITGTTAKYHGAQHGWEFYAGDNVKLKMGGKGYIKLGLCQYSGSGNIILTAPDGTTQVGMTAAKVNTDGTPTTIQYDGKQGAGELTLSFSGTTYLHNISIVNMTKEPYTGTEVGDIEVINTEGNTDLENGNNFITTLELANSTSGTDRKVIFLPNGTYDLGERTLTQVSRNNISIIGESMEGVIIKNSPTAEGIGVTATLLNTSTGLYLQDLTLQNAWNYYGIDGDGRAVCLQDKGAKTICKNVRLLSYQDTYYSNSSSLFYWEDCEIHGTVDYVCGAGDVYFNRVTFVNESRAADSKSGEDVIAAPYPGSSEQYGYVMNNCIIENKAAKFSLGRSWGGQSKLAWLNTTINQPSEVLNTDKVKRFTVAGMNVAAYRFKEYNSIDTNGNVVSPASNEVTFTHDNGNYTYETILTDAEAANYTLDKVFGTSWTPSESATQLNAPTNAKIDNGVITWTAVSGAKAYGVFANDVLLTITDATTYTVTTTGAKSLGGSTTTDTPTYTIRTANAMGGFGKAANVATTPTGINEIGNQSGNVVGATYYSADGTRLSTPQKGINIVKMQMSDGSQKTVKVIVK